MAEITIEPLVDHRLQDGRIIVEAFPEYMAFNVGAVLKALPVDRVVRMKIEFEYDNGSAVYEVVGEGPDPSVSMLVKRVSSHMRLLEGGN